LATAPWNRLSNPDPRGFRAVGSALFRFARFRSEELGYGELVGLHSLPAAEAFYRKLGMIDGGADAEKDNLTYFEWYRRDFLRGQLSQSGKSIELFLNEQFGSVMSPEEIKEVAASFQIQIEERLADKITR
jgi:hypothetical protein